jgi:plasmid stabilization system protein ParE
MHRVVYAPEAEAQLVALYFHIAAAASPAIAANYTEAIVKQCESLKTFPSAVRDMTKYALDCASSAFESALPSLLRLQTAW